VDAKPDPGARKRRKLSEKMHMLVLFSFYYERLEIVKTTA
jgi:hypothetical protein